MNRSEISDISIDGLILGGEFDYIVTRIEYFVELLNYSVVLVRALIYTKFYTRLQITAFPNLNTQGSRGKAGVYIPNPRGSWPRT